MSASASEREQRTNANLIKFMFLIRGEKQKHRQPTANTTEITKNECKEREKKLHAENLIAII